MAGTYKGRQFVRQREIVCGDYMDADVFPVFQPPGKRRKKCKPTKEAQKKLNQRDAERRFRRLLLLNFTEQDVYLTLSYSREPESREQAARDCKNFLRRVKYALGKRGTELKWMKCTVGGAEGTRTHHHLILSGGLDRDELEGLWGLGYANSRRLRLDLDGAQGLSRYITRQKRTSYRRWSGSRNLARPEPRQTDGEISLRELGDLAADVERGSWGRVEALYPGWEIIEARADWNTVNRGVYVRLELRRKRPGRRRE